MLPNFQSEHFPAYGEDRTQFQGITLEYRRFMSESILECFRLEYQEIKKEMPVITKNRAGQGYAYYVGTRSNDEFYRNFMEHIFSETNIPETMVTPKGVEASIRVKEGREILFLMNHNGERERVTLNDSYRDLLNGTEYRTGHSIEIEGKGVFVLLKCK